MTVSSEAFEDLRNRLLAMQTAIMALEDDFRLLKATIDARQLELTQMGATVKRCHHDHQNVRQMVMNSLDELDRLAPRTKGNT